MTKLMHAGWLLLSSLWLTACVDEYRLKTQALRDTEEHYLELTAYKGRILNNDVMISWENNADIVLSPSGLFIDDLFIAYAEIASIEITDFLSEGLTVFNSDVLFEDLLIIKLKDSYGCWGGCVLRGLHTVGSDGKRLDETLLTLVQEKSSGLDVFGLPVLPRPVWLSADAITPLRQWKRVPQYLKEHHGAELSRLETTFDQFLPAYSSDFHTSFAAKLDESLTDKSGYSFHLLPESLMAVALWQRPSAIAAATKGTGEDYDSYVAVRPGLVFMAEKISPQGEVDIEVEFELKFWFCNLKWGNCFKPSTESITIRKPMKEWLDTNVLLFRTCTEQVVDGAIKRLIDSLQGENSP